MGIKSNRGWGFAIIAAIYAAAAIIGVFVFRAFPNEHIFLRLLLGDVCATVLVYLTGLPLRNASVYDPYWSVQPIVILTGVAVYFNALTIGTTLLLAAVAFWGLRLTVNWAHTFRSLNSQDWRYDMFKRRFPHIFQLISFFGINMFPTIVVYLVLLPGVAFIERGDVNIITVFGFIVCISAAFLELVSDFQMQRFRKANPDRARIIRDGLWKHARHPNYLGEILMWWGVYIMMLSALPGMWYLGAGAFVNTLMFIFISIPLADRRNSEKQGFAQYKSETRSMLPIPKPAKCDRITI